MNNAEKFKEISSTSFYCIIPPQQNIVMLFRQHHEVYDTDEPALNANNEIIDFPGDNNNSASFKCKQQTT